MNYIMLEADRDDILTLTSVQQWQPMVLKGGINKSSVTLNGILMHAW